MILKSSNLVPPKAIGIVYSKDLRKLVKAMIKDYKSLIEIYRDKKDQIAEDANDTKFIGGTWLTTEIEQRLKKLGKKWEAKFAEAAESLSPRIVKRMLKATDTQLKQALVRFYSRERLELIGNVVPTPLRQVMKAHISENASLIKSIQSKYHEQVEGSVWRSITGRGSIKTLSEEILSYGAKTENRANLIALDQTRKMYSTMNLERFKQVGVKKVQWLHTHGGKTVRPYHFRKWDGKSGLNDGHPNGLNGFIFDLDKPPVIQEATKTQPEIRGYPAELPFCTCTWAAVFEE